MASNRVKTRELKSGEIIAYSESAIRNNASAVEYCRTSMAALSGSTAGLIINLEYIHNSEYNLKILTNFRYNGSYWNSWFSILFGRCIGFMVFAIDEIWFKLAKIFY